MPKKPAISHAQMQEILLSKSNVIDEKGIVSGPSQVVWEELSNSTFGVYTPNYIYVYVKTNRCNILTKILEQAGLNRPTQENETEDSLTEKEDSSLEESDEDETQQEKRKNFKLLKPMKTFKVLITPEMWLAKVKPVISSRARSDRPGKVRNVFILPKFKWEPAIVECLWEQHKIPCPYTFRRASVKTSSDRDCYISIEALCSDCGAEASGKILVEPQENEAVPLLWSANDSRGIPHQKKRPLSHFERKEVGESLQGISAAAFRREKAAKTMNQGDVEPPHLHSKTVLRKAKQKTLDNSLKIPQTGNTVTNLQAMKYSEPYAGSVHQIGLDPFFVHYHSPAQLHIFKKFVAKSYVVLAIDATGSLVQRLRTPSGRRSPHIFLYEGVILAGSEQLPVCQMLSARQDANAIKFWLDELLRQGAPIPHEVVMDHSKALLNAAVVTFCGCYSLKDYYERCFHALSCQEDSAGFAEYLPRSFLRLDLAHLIGGAAKWSIWKDKVARRLKLFYLQCLGLLALETNPEEFRDSFIQVGVSATCKFSDSKLTASVQKIIKRIEGTPNELQNHIKASEESYNTDSDPDEPDCDTSHSQSVKEFCKEVKQEIESESKRLDCGQTPNPYYCPDVVSRFLYLLPDFLLWTAIMVDPFQSPTLTGSSARVEGDFSVVKQGILSGNRHLTELDKFVARHLQSIEGSCRIAEAGDRLQSHLLSNEEKSTRNEVKSSRNGAASSRNIVEIEIKEEESSRNEEENTKNEEVSRNKESKNDIQSIRIESLKSKTSRSNGRESEEDCSDETDQQKALSEMENWKGRSPPPPKKPKTSKYLNCNPELSLVLNSKILQPPKERVLQNGLKMGFVKTAGAMIQLTNTCSFDVLAQLITCAWTQYEGYRNSIETHLAGKAHHLIDTCKSLALRGAVAETYLLRVEALTAITTPSTLVAPTRSGQTKKEDIPSYTYDCFSDLVDTARKLLSVFFSSTVTSKCTQKTARRPCTPEDSETVINADIDVLSEGGLKEIDKAILVSLGMMGVNDKELPSSNVRKDIPCSKPCTGVATFECKFGPHLIINVDVFGSSLLLEGLNTKVTIEDVPCKLKLLGRDFILCGIASRQSSHYVAYGRKVTGQWESYNDLHKEVRGVKSTQQIEPVLLIYVPMPN